MALHLSVELVAQALLALQVFVLELLLAQHRLLPPLKERQYWAAFCY
jgi:hypothetical protein